MTSVQCSVCSARIISETDRIYCFGGCNQVLHMKCSDLGSACLGLMQKNIGLKYMCFDCRKHQTTLNDVLKMCSELLCKIDLLSTAVNNLEPKFLDTIKSQCQEVEDRVVLRIESTLENVAQTEETFATVTRSGKNSKRKATDLPSNDNTTNLTDNSGLLRSGKRRKTVFLKTDKANTKTSHSSESTSSLPSTEVACNETIMKMKQTVLFKPKKTQPIEATKQIIREKFDPVTFSVKEVQYRNTGEVSVRCDSNERALKLIDSAKTLLHENYDIELLRPLRPRLKIVGITDELSEEEIVEKIKLQNNLPETSYLKVIRVLNKQTRNNSGLTVIAETDALSFYQLTKLQRINIGWERCKVFEVVDVMRCYKCSEYGHKAATCVKQLCCPKCAEAHEANECVSDIAKCINCHNQNENLNALNTEKLDISHHSWSSQCPLYKKRLEKAKLRIDYTI
ncbi:uncharacterized protein LOC131439098 [Malaya genurostris]|uniref:uncharacterized protein LOC131439098 n=1 Tax=Malaya genurostris TaxID=325434 RepID=UPI0026F3D1E1|nr:uncharacterized protein LOC131439098 [Malaya genurostris]